MLREKNFKNLDDRETVTVYTGEASFRSPYEIVVKTDTDSFLLEGEKIFINTGATTIIPTISGIEDNPYVYTSTSIMELEKLPRHLVIVGGGYIGAGIRFHVRRFWVEGNDLGGRGGVHPS